LAFLLSCRGYHRYLHSFPTRRSSDLGVHRSSDRQTGGAMREQDEQMNPCEVTAEAPTPLSTPALASHRRSRVVALGAVVVVTSRSEEHTSELQSRENLVCRLLLEKKI